MVQNLPKKKGLSFKIQTTKNMNIEAKDFEMRLNYAELWTLTYDVQTALKYSITTHWVNHQESWKQNEKERLFKLQSMYNALGRPDMYENAMIEFEEIIKKFNNQKENKPQKI